MYVTESKHFVSTRPVTDASEKDMPHFFHPDPTLIQYHAHQHTERHRLVRRLARRGEKIRTKLACDHCLENEA